MTKIYTFAVFFTSAFAVFSENVAAQIGGSGAIVAIDEVREGSGKAKELPDAKFQNKPQTFPTEKKTSSKTAE